MVWAFFVLIGLLGELRHWTFNFVLCHKYSSSFKVPLPWLMVCLFSLFSLKIHRCWSSLGFGFKRTFFCIFLCQRLIIELVGILNVKQAWLKDNDLLLVCRTFNLKHTIICIFLDRQDLRFKFKIPNQSLRLVVPMSFSDDILIDVFSFTQHEQIHNCNWLFLVKYPDNSLIIWGKKASIVDSFKFCIFIF
jgi:hypothetical protein